MKKTFLLSVITLTVLMLGWVDSLAIDRQTNREAPKVELIAELSKKSYENKDDKLTTVTVKLELNLTYTNIGNIPIVLFNNLNFLSSYRICKTLDDCNNGVYEFAPNFDWISVSLGETPKYKTDDFILLKPKEFFRTVGSLYIPLSKNSHNNEGFPTPGSRYIQVSTWTAPKLNKKLLNLLSRKGVYLNHSINSIPMYFTLE